MSIKKFLCVAAVALTLLIGFGGCAPTVEIDPAKVQIQDEGFIEIEIIPPSTQNPNVQPPKVDPKKCPVFNDFSNDIFFNVDQSIFMGTNPYTDLPEDVLPPQVNKAAPIVTLDEESLEKISKDLRMTEMGGEFDEYIINGKPIKVPKGSIIKYNERVPASGTSSSAGLKTNLGNADKIVGDWNTEAPQVKLKGVGSATGGDTSFDFKIIVEKKIMIFYILAAVVVIVGGVAAWYLKNLKIFLAAVGIALVLVVLGYLVNSAGWILIIIGLVGAAGLGFWLWTMWKTKKDDTTIDAVVGAIEKLQPVTETKIAEKKGEVLKTVVDVAAIVRNAIKNEAGEVNLATVRKTVRKSKARKGLTASA